MKHIKKGAQPQSLIKWRAENAKFPDAQYGSHHFPTADVKLSLLEEQGWICAYTMIRVAEASSHIEHLKPRTVSRDEGKLEETAAYENMVACYPKAALGVPPVGFGAVYRDSKWDVDKFLSPLQARCETAYLFRMNGMIEPTPKTNADAMWMIESLALDAGPLRDLRCSAIEAIGLSLTSDHPVSPKQAKQLFSDICKPDGQGRFRPFCIALRHAAQEYIQVIEKKAKQKKYIRAANKRRQK